MPATSNLGIFHPMQPYGQRGRKPRKHTGFFGISSLISMCSGVGITDICASQLHMDAHGSLCLISVLIHTLAGVRCLPNVMYFPCQVFMIYACNSNIAQHICNCISLSRNIALFYRKTNVNSNKKRLKIRRWEQTIQLQPC